MTLTWTDRSTNELVFGVQYRDHGGAWKNAPSVPSTSTSTTGKTYTTTHTVPYGTIFCYHISAGNLGGVNYSPAACAVPAAPGKPTTLRSGSYSETYGDQRNLVYFNRSAVWEWGYRLYTRRQDSTGWVFNSELVSGPPTSATEQMRAINLPENGTYCLRVVAFNSRGVSEATTEDVCISTTPIIE
ncbi:MULTISPECIES: hypothetical protein [Pseudarthrobacter]|uniref:hypothetical protein n=1 Tax=Pseudarthrobacter TaxID=1742993 RepID=UPI0013DA7EC1|nr:MULTISPECIES: hypothetical protein [Pseudarthrobacter]MDP9999636.1 hypothetical protein [Pseudarthrobacter sulfonivorans]